MQRASKIANKTGGCRKGGAMSLLNTNQLSARFEELVRTATSIDIAVAWVRSCDELDKLCARARDKPVRVIVGLAGNITQPVALRSLRGVGASAHQHLISRPESPLLADAFAVLGRLHAR